MTCCEQMKRALDPLYDETMVLDDNRIYPQCRDCGSHDLDPISFCPYCGSKL